VHDTPLLREFAGLGGRSDRLPDESTILRLRHLLEEHKLADKTLETVNDLVRAKALMLRACAVVDATLLAAPTSTKNSSGERDPVRRQSKTGNPWYFAMKAHIGVDAESGPVQTVRSTAGSVNDGARPVGVLYTPRPQASRSLRQRMQHIDSARLSTETKPWLGSCLHSVSLRPG
jgi:IS5 family transposase